MNTIKLSDYQLKLASALVSDKIQDYIDVVEESSEMRDLERLQGLLMALASPVLERKIAQYKVGDETTEPVFTEGQTVWTEGLDGNNKKVATEGTFVDYLDSRDIEVTHPDPETGVLLKIDCQVKTNGWRLFFSSSKLYATRIECEKSLAKG